MQSLQSLQQIWIILECIPLGKNSLCCNTLTHIYLQSKSDHEDKSKIVCTSMSWPTTLAYNNWKDYSNVILHCFINQVKSWRQTSCTRTSQTTNNLNIIVHTGFSGQFFPHSTIIPIIEEISWVLHFVLRFLTCGATLFFFMISQIMPIFNFIDFSLIKEVFVKICCQNWSPTYTD